MRSSTFLALVALLALPSTHFAFAAAEGADQEISEQELVDDEGDDDAAARASNIQGSMQNVVCLDSSTLNVRSSNLKKVLYSVKKYEKVKMFQGWGNNAQVKNINGKKHTFVKVQFPSREEKNQDSTGWIAKGFIKPASQCAGAVKEEKKIAEKVEREQPSSRQSVNGLDDPNCCEFPLARHPDRSITAPGMWNFGWRRSGGARTHAACDMYQSKGDPVLAVAPGTVVRDLYYFYQNTYALEVRHNGGFVVRYGEVLGRKAANISGGRRVNQGQVVGYVGKTSHPNPMLHFEMYKGTAQGSLSNRGNKFQRRSDLMNPTQHLVKWESAKFRDRH